MPENPNLSDQPPVLGTPPTHENGSKPTPESVLGIANPLVVRVTANGEVHLFKPEDQINPGDQLRVVVAGLDIDGTEIDEELPEPERMPTIGPAKLAIAGLKELRISMAPATGRAFGEAKVVYDETQAVGITIAEDGGILVLPESIDEKSLSELKAKYGEQRIVEHNGRMVLLISQVHSRKSEGSHNIEDLWERYQKQYKDTHPGFKFVTPSALRESNLWLSNQLAGLSTEIARLKAQGEDVTKLQEQADQLQENANIRVVATTFDSAADIREMVGHPTDEAAAASADRVVSAYIAGLNPAQEAEFTKMANAEHMHTFGPPLHVLGDDSDKGEALRVLDEVVHLLLKDYGFAGIYPIGIGNNVNDVALARAARKVCGSGMAFIVAKPSTTEDHAIAPSHPQYKVQPEAISEEDRPFVKFMPRPYGYGMQDAVKAIAQFFGLPEPKFE